MTFIPVCEGVDIAACSGGGELYLIHSGPHRNAHKFGESRACGGIVGPLCKEHTICDKCHTIWSIPYDNIMMMAKMQEWE